jgi:hypothetical protein
LSPYGSAQYVASEVLALQLGQEAYSRADLLVPEGSYELNTAATVSRLKYMYMWGWDTAVCIRGGYPMNWGLVPGVYVYVGLGYLRLYTGWISDELGFGSWCICICGVGIPPSIYGVDIR